MIEKLVQRKKLRTCVKSYDNVQEETLVTEILNLLTIFNAKPQLGHDFFQNHFPNLFLFLLLIDNKQASIYYLPYGTFFFSSKNRIIFPMVLNFGKEGNVTNTIYVFKSTNCISVGYLLSK